MSDFRRVTDAFSVAPQISVEDVARAKAEGFVLIVNNRPDGEEPGQPSGARIEAAARAAGLAYVAIPVVGGPTRDQAEKLAAFVEEAGGRVLAYCRSGTRSINTWALGRALAGDDRMGLARAGGEAGYDLRMVLGV